MSAESELAQAFSARPGEQRLLGLHSQGKMTPSQNINTAFRTIILVLSAVQGCSSESISPWPRRQEAPDRSEGSEASALGKEKADIWDLLAWLRLGSGRARSH